MGAQRMLELLVAEAEYLVDEGTLEALARMDEKQARVARADAVLKVRGAAASRRSSVPRTHCKRVGVRVGVCVQAIGVEREEDVDELLSYFFDPSLTDAEPGEDVATLVDLNLKVCACPRRCARETALTQPMPLPLFPSPPPSPLSPRRWAQTP